MSEQKSVKSKNIINVIVLLAVIVLLTNFFIDKPKTGLSILGSLVGLGFIIFIHELGHFLAGKFSNINVEMFAVGMGPVLFGVKRFENGFRVRVLPTMFAKDNDEAGEGLLCFTIPGKYKSGETEYQIRLVPVGGFVKLMGQEDMGADVVSDNPRSFVNAPIWKRICVGAAGVTLNVVLAVILFVVVYSIGIKMTPAVVGGVMDGFPADKAGLVAGDEILEVNGQGGLNFSDVAMAAALAGDKPVQMKVKRTDGSIEEISLSTEVMPGMGFSGFGIAPAGTLEIANVEDANALYSSTGLSAGDKLVMVGTKKVEHFWEYDKAIKKVFAKEVFLIFEKADGSAPLIKNFDIEYLSAYSYKDGGDFVPANVYGLVPRLKITSIGSEDADKVLDAGDVILAVGDIENPNYKQLREMTEANAGNQMPIRVLRNGNVIDVNVMPKMDDAERVIVGISVGLDVESTVVASAVKVEGLDEIGIAGSSTILTINNTKVGSYYDIANAFKANTGKMVSIVFDNNGRSERVDLAVPAEGDFVAVKSVVAVDLPFAPLKRLYKASGPLDAAKLGYRRTVGFILQSYMTLKGLIVGEISPKSLMGPVGMIHASSKIIGAKAFLEYIHFMAIISACLAVMNFLPLPILDGGLVLLLIIEKIKGSPVNTKVQEVITYIGLALIGTLFVVITFNDIIRLFF